MKDEVKSKITRLSEKAGNMFLSYQTVCQQIAQLIQEETDEEILEVLYQMSYGLVVSVDRNQGVELNIPIEDYLKEIEK